MELDHRPYYTEPLLIPSPKSNLLDEETHAGKTMSICCGVGIEYASMAAERSVR